MTIHFFVNAQLVFGALFYKPNHLLPWVSMEISGLVFHVALGATILTTFLSPKAYAFADKEFDGALIAGTKKVVQDWGLFLTHIVWRLFWIRLVSNFRKEISLDEAKISKFWKI